MSGFYLLSALLLSSVNLVSTQSVDPSTIPDATKDAWCTSQEAACPLICLQLPNVTSETTESNTCDSTTLAYSCVCENGQQPNASEYSQTVPYFLCTYENDQCVSNCGNGNSACQSACRSDNPCGAQNPTRVNTSTISTMSATATSGSAATSDAGTTAVYTGFAGAAATTTAASSSKNGAETLVNFGKLYGLGVVATGLFAGFTLFL